MTDVVTVQPDRSEAAPPAASGSARAKDDALPDLQGHLPALDGLRGLAIALVMLCHFLPEEVHPRSSAARFLFFLGKEGRTGVDLFFVLSGFLITGILLDTKGGGETKHYFRNFYARRTLRIFPIYYGVLAVIFLLIPLMNPHAFNTPDLMRVRHEQGWLWTYCTNIKMARVVSSGSMAFYAGWLELNTFWSLAVEEHFYILWPALVYFLRRSTLVGFCCLIIVGSALVRAAMIHRGMVPWAVYVFTPCRVDSLAIGSLLAVVLRGDSSIKRFLTAHAGKLVVVLGVAALIWMGTNHGKVIEAVVRYPLLFLFFAALLVKSLTASRTSWVGRFFHAGPMRSLGKYSYGLYVYHSVLLGVYDRWFGQEKTEAWLQHHSVHGNVAYWGSILTYIVLAGTISFAIAFASWHLYERQFLRLKRYFAYEGPKPHRTTAPGTPGVPAAAAPV